MQIKLIGEIPPSVDMGMPSESSKAKMLDGLSRIFRSDIFLKLRYGPPTVEMDDLRRYWNFHIDDSFYARLEYFFDDLTGESGLRLLTDQTNAGQEEADLCHSHFLNMFIEEIKRTRVPRMIRNKDFDRQRLMEWSGSS